MACWYRYQTIILESWTYVDLLSIGSSETIFSGTSIETKHFQSLKCISRYRLKTGSHFVLASLYQLCFINIKLIKHCNTMFCYDCHIFQLNKNLLWYALFPGIYTSWKMPLAPTCVGWRSPASQPVSLTLQRSSASWLTVCGAVYWEPFLPSRRHSTAPPSCHQQSRLHTRYVSWDALWR